MSNDILCVIFLTLLGISGSPYVVNCQADVQVLFEVSQFQFLPGDKEKPVNKIFTPKRVFTFESQNQRYRKDLDCSKIDSTQQHQFYLKEAEDVKVWWILGKKVKDTPDCGFDNSKCPDEDISSKHYTCI